MQPEERTLRRHDAALGKAARGIPIRQSSIIGLHFGNGVKGNVRFQSSSARRGMRREAVNKQKAGRLCIPKLESSPQDSLANGFLLAMSTSTQQGNLAKVRLHQRFSPGEPDVNAWIRDEPDVPGSGFLQSGSSSGTGVGRNSSGSGGFDCSTEVGGGHSVADGSGSPEHTSELIEQARHKASSSYLYAQLKGTMIKESVILEGIQRLGGGQKGLRGVVKAILFWLEAKNRHHNSQTSDSCIASLDLPAHPITGMDQFSWSNLECASDVDARQIEHFCNLNNLNHSSPTDSFTGLVSPVSSSRDNEGSLCDLRIGGRGSGEYGQVPNHEGQIFMGGPEGLGGLPSGLRSQGSGPAQIDMPAVDWVPPMRDYSTIRQEKSHRARLIRKHSPSPDRSGLHCAQEVHAFDDALSHQNKIRRHSLTAGSYTSSQCANDFPTYLSTATPEVLGAQGIFTGSNPFAPGGPFNLSPSSPPTTDPHSMDFIAFGTQGSILIDENMSLGSSVPGCGLFDRHGSLRYPLSPETTSLDRKPPCPRLGEVRHKSKASPAACTRLARKQRMDRNRKASLYQANRGTLEAGAVLTGKSGGMGSSASGRCIGRSQGSPAADGKTCSTIDRRNQENLQLLLLKVLRPSDVGNLGRIVLPKKDAENHLPWLCAREGIQFACEDYDTGEMMMLRYRFWPNNKSRMYLLENTGDFVKRHQLQESDRMMIYRNQPQGTYIIRARKAQDCVDGKHDYAESLPSLDHHEDTEGDGKETSELNSPGGSSGTSSLSGAESTLCSGHDGASESCAPASTIITSQNLLNFADLPDAPMGEGAEHLVRFPSLESFDVELLNLPSVSLKEVTSCRAKTKEE